MIFTELLAMFYGVAAALSFGAGDFSGGLAAKRSNVFGVVLFSQCTGLLLVLALIPLFGETLPAAGDLLWGAVAGVSGAMGLLALYRSLAIGRMGVVAPLSAVITAVIPIIFTLFRDGLPRSAQLLGFFIALLAVWFLAQSDGQTVLARNDLRLPLLAGLGFGGFFLAIDQATADALFWPLAAARLASISLVFIFTRGSGQKLWSGARPLRIIILAGTLDIAGNTFFILAAQNGRLDIATVLSSLFPATTILLARFILKEKLSRRQQTGVVAALLALLLIAL